MKIQLKPDDCKRCWGGGRIADSQDGEPWAMWQELPPGSDLAAKMGIVKPIPCPQCGGTGKLPAEPEWDGKSVERPSPAPERDAWEPKGTLISGEVLRAIAEAVTMRRASLPPILSDPSTGICAAIAELIETRQQLRQVQLLLGKAASEINCAGPVDHRIRMLKQKHAGDYEALMKENEALRKELELVKSR